jgi:hypothetical protein
MAAKSDIVFTGVKDEHFKLFSATGATGTQVQYNKSYLSYFRTFRPSLQGKKYSKRGDKTQNKIIKLSLSVQTNNVRTTFKRLICSPYG